MNKGSQVTKESGYDSDNFMSKWFNLWIIPLFVRGYKHPVDFKDVTLCPSADLPEQVTRRLEKVWTEMLNAGQPSILVALIKIFGWRFLWLNLSLVIVDLVTRITQPFMISVIINYIRIINSESNDSNGSSLYVHLSAAGLVVTSVVFCWSHHQIYLQMLRIGNNARSAITALVYKKLLTQHANSLNIGNVINVITNDLDQLEEISGIAYAFLLAPIMAAIVFYLTYSILGLVPTLAAVAVLVTLIPLQSLIGKLFTRFRSQTSAITDSRLKLINEIITHIKLVKLYTWEDAFSARVAEKRKQEIKKMTKSYMAKSISSSLNFIGSSAMVFAAVITYTFMGGQLNPEILFIVTGLFNAIRYVLTNILSYAIAITSEAVVTFRRVEAILTTDCPVLEVDNGHAVAKGEVIISDFSCKWKPDSSEVLKRIDLKVQPGQLIMITGPVGAGKSCLLNSLLGETMKTSGSIQLNGAVSYCGQDPWLFGESIRRNIILSSHLDIVRYTKVLDLCQLRDDLRHLTNGDLTIVGDKGVILSGGQKTRVALARSIYHEADCYLLDDPFSSVDVNVASEIFNKCLLQHLKDKTVVLVTHHLQLLPSADLILFLSQGETVATGIFDQLVNDCDEFKLFIGSCTTLTGDNDSDQSSIKSTKVADGSSEEDQLREDEENLVDAMHTTGSLGKSIYSKYFRSSGSYLLIVTSIVATLFSQAVTHFIEFWMALWASMSISQEDYSLSVTSVTLITKDQETNVAIYSSLMALLFVLIISRNCLVYLICLKCSINLHKKTFESVVKTSIKFFEQTPIGQVLNRFTRDLGMVDVNLPMNINELNLSVVSSIGIVIMSIVVTPFILIPVVVLLAMSICLRSFYIKTAREIQRLDSKSKSPIYTHISNTFNGITTIRSFNLTQAMVQDLYKYLTDSVSCHFSLIVANRAFGIALDFIICIYIACLCGTLVATSKGSISDGDAGVILTNSMLLLGLFQYSIRLTGDFETHMVSVERIFEYGSLELEETSTGVTNSVVTDGTDLQIGSNELGQVEFKNVSLAYSPNDPPAVDDVSFTIRPTEKIGIVGRTGAGKSSLISLLFRLKEHNSGSIFVNGIDTGSLSLKQLRSMISIIPQDPSLFSGTIRSNLDPFGEYSDEELYSAIDKSMLSKLVTNQVNCLHFAIDEGGSNLSLGQRQLVCLARAILKKNKIIVLDEATSNVDQETDQTIQRIIKEDFYHCTIITIAHRINIVLNMDKILVMSDGKAVEFDSPANLLLNRQSIFRSMVEQV